MDIITLTKTAVNDWFGELDDADRIQLGALGVDQLYFVNNFLVEYRINEFEINGKNSVSTDKIYSIQAFFYEFLEGKKMGDFYDNYNGKRTRRESIPEISFAWEANSKLIYDQLKSTFKIFDERRKETGGPRQKPLEKSEIPASAIPNLLFYLKMFYHPTMKAFRTGKFSGLTMEDWEDFMIKSANYTLEDADERSLNRARYTAEVVLKNQLYASIVGVADYTKEIVINDLMAHDQMNSLIMRKHFLKIYAENLISALELSRKQTKLVVEGYAQAREYIVDDLSNAEFKEELLNTVEDLDYLDKLLDIVTSETDYYRINTEAASEETFKKVMKMKEVRSKWKNEK